ncbi:hypothetical protein ACLMMR_38540, partial [Streptomyces sp. NPDC000405]
MARITSTADFVTWDAFEQPHRKTRDYAAFGPFQVDRHQYDDALRALILQSQLWGLTSAFVVAAASAGLT